MNESIANAREIKPVGFRDHCRQFRESPCFVQRLDTSVAWGHPPRAGVEIGGTAVRKTAAVPQTLPQVGYCVSGRSLYFCNE